MANRQHLQNLADDYGLDLATVEMFSDALGGNEDHDGLITMLEDFSDDDLFDDWD
jgi:hypothetical protein